MCLSHFRIGVKQVGPEQPMIGGIANGVSGCALSVGCQVDLSSRVSVTVALAVAACVVVCVSGRALSCTITEIRVHHHI